MCLRKYVKETDLRKQERQDEFQAEIQKSSLGKFQAEQANASVFIIRGDFSKAIGKFSQIPF